MTKTYLFLVGAIFFEVAGTMLLPVTQNFTKLVPTSILNYLLFISILFTYICSKQTSYRYRLCYLERIRSIHNCNIRIHFL